MKPVIPYVIVLTILSSVRGLEFWHRSRQRITPGNGRKMVNHLLYGLKKQRPINPHVYSFSQLKIKEDTERNNDCVSISFEIPTDLKDSYSLQHGQNITIKKEINGEETRRSYSICSSPLDNELRVAVKKVEGGAFRRWLIHC